MAAGAERAGFEEFVAPNGSKKLRCRLTGHEIADRPEAIAAHLASRRYRIAAAKVPKESVAEWEKHYIVPSKNGGHGRGVLYCTLTRTHLNAVKEELEAHIQGRRYKAALERMQARGKAPKAEGEEPSSDEEDDEEDDERAEGDEGEIPLIDDGDEAGDEEAEADEEDDGVEEVPAEEARPFAVRAKPDGKRKKREREAVAEVAAVPAAGDDKARRRQGEAKEAKAEAKSAEAKAVPPKKAKAEAAVVDTEAPQPKKAKAKEAAAQAEAEEPKKAKAKAKEEAAAAQAAAEEAQAEAEEARQAKKAKAKAKEAAAAADLGFEEVPASRPSHVNRANVASDDDDDEAVEKRLVARIFG